MKKNVYMRGSKKVLKRGTGRFAIENVFSKEGRIRPARNAFTRTL